MEPVIVEGFDIIIDRGEVLRFLGSAERIGRHPSERVEQALGECLRAAGVLVKQRGIYVITVGSALPGSKMFTDLDRVAFCVCTIGHELEREVSRRSGEDDLLGAVVLDSVGSVAAEAVADFMDWKIQEEAAREGLRASCRASPGYGDWDVREQESIFRLLPAERIGVRLTDSMMMVPRKSVSFAVHIAESPVRLRSENSCRNCEREDCPFRLIE
jgi:hypothetical protein